MRRLIPLLFAIACKSPVDSLPVVPPVVEAGPPLAVQPAIIEAGPVVVTSWIAPREVLIIGDSEACAVSYVVKATVKQINIDAKQPEDVVNVDCKGGTVVPYWGTGGHFRAALARHPKTDAVLIFLGTNHYWNQKDTPNVVPILDLIKEKGLNCVWVGNTAVHGKHWNINNLLRTAVTPTCSYFDTEAANIPLADGVHPDRAGSVKWLKAIWPTIPLRYEENDE
jgi:hypothetical protein